MLIGGPTVMPDFTAYLIKLTCDCYNYVSTILLVVLNMQCMESYFILLLAENNKTATT